MRIKKIAQTPGLVATVVDNLNSTSVTDALSANQGRFLREEMEWQYKAIEEIFSKAFPTGGTTGQVLTKKSNTSYDAQWADPAKKEITTGEEYATNEYIDGKRVYRKRINIGNLPTGEENHTVSFTPHNLTNFSLVRFDGYAYSEKFGVYTPLPRIDKNSERVIEIEIYPNEIVIRCYHDYSNYVGYVDLYYTKK